MSEENLIDMGEISERDFYEKINESSNPLEEFGQENPQPNEQEFAYENPQPNTGNFSSNQQPNFGANNIGQKVAANNIISSDIAFSLVDNVLPLALIYILSMVDRKARKSELQASKAESETIKVVLDNCLKNMNVNFDNPFIALGVVLTGVYGSKAVEIYLSKEPEVKESNTPHVSKTGAKRGRPKKY